LPLILNKFQCTLLLISLIWPHVIIRGEHVAYIQNDQWHHGIKVVRSALHTSFNTNGVTVQDAEKAGLSFSDYGLMVNGEFKSYVVNILILRKTNTS
jgi:hypothetical protein